ncbi:MAG: hypothetical protein D6802_00885 [Ardenticatenia bacterium]|nr:MAG: hypothetical protein D6802_00885 [Ardenticatenia bacterium]
METCFICEEKQVEQPNPANAECSECGRYACYDHMIRVQRGEFLCLACYENNEEFYREHRRLIQRPRYNVPRNPAEDPNKNRSYARPLEENNQSDQQKKGARGLLARLRARLGM